MKKGIFVFVTLQVLENDLWLSLVTRKRAGQRQWRKKTSRKERLQQLLTKHDVQMRAESSFTYADISQRIFQGLA